MVVIPRRFSWCKFSRDRPVIYITVLARFTRAGGVAPLGREWRDPAGQHPAVRG